jgi:hypothetical protein
MSRSIVLFSGAVVVPVLLVLALRTPERNAKRTETADNEIQSTAPVETPTAPVTVPNTWPTSRSADSSPSEAVLTERLRATLGKSAPQAALDLAREIDRQYPDGVQAEERSLYIIDALIALDQISEMRDEARRHLSKWPNSEISMRVMARTGVHPEPKPLP